MLQNGEAAPEYQSLVLELEALDRALHQLETLEPTQHELLQLRAIRATALTCQRPLQDFLTKISKFEGTMGTFNAKNNRFKGFSRRMQWRKMFKEDVKNLRSVLGSHVGTINLLLMTQTIGSLTAAERDRDRLQSELVTKILSHRRLLENVQDRVEFSIEKQCETNLHLQNQSAALCNLAGKADQTNSNLRDQQAILEGVEALALTTQEQTTSILSATTNIMALATSGFMNLQQIAQQLVRMFQLCAAFTTEMRVAMANLTQLFLSLHTVLRRIELALPTRLSLPIVQFTDALGCTMALPYQLCQQWSTFRELLGVIFIDKPGKSRVDEGLFRIMQDRGGRLLQEASWQHSVNPDDHLSMSIVVDELEAIPGHCPFPSCQACLSSAEATNGGHTCPNCGRWALSNPRRKLEDSESEWLDQECLNEEIGPYASDDEVNHDYILYRYDDTGENKLIDSPAANQEQEDIEVYRQIHVLTSDLPRPSTHVDAGPTLSQSQLTDEEFHSLFRAVLLYGDIKDRKDDILRSSGLEGRDIEVLKESIADVHKEAQRHLRSSPRTPKSKLRQNILFNYRGLKGLSAAVIIKRPIKLRWLSEYL